MASWPNFSGLKIGAGNCSASFIAGTECPIPSSSSTRSMPTSFLFASSATAESASSKRDVVIQTLPQTVAQL